METYKTEYKPQDKGYRVKSTVCRVRKAVFFTFFRMLQGSIDNIGSKQIEMINIILIKLERIADENRILAIETIKNAHKTSIYTL